MQLYFIIVSLLKKQHKALTAYRKRLGLTAISTRKCKRLCMPVVCRWTPYRRAARDWIRWPKYLEIIINILIYRLYKNAVIVRSIVSVSDLSILPAKSPQMIVDITGVLVLGLIFDKNLKSKPSLAIANKIRGSGKSVPKRLYKYTNYKKIFF